jgi:hypothetical protein
MHCRNFKAELRSKGRSVDLMKFRREKYFRNFIPYNQSEFFRGIYQVCVLFYAAQERLPQYNQDKLKTSQISRTVTI